MSKINNWVFFIGPGKTGSSWLYKNLFHHPDIKLPKNIKETNFFLDDNFIKQDLYSSFFDYGKDKKYNLDISNTYIYKEDVANRIFNFEPSSKIVIGYRDPFSRIESAFHFKKRNGEIPQIETLESSLIDDKFDLIKTNYYTKLTQPYINNFGLENIFILEFSRLQNDPKKLLIDLFKFLSVKVHFNEKFLDKKINPASSFRIKQLSYLSKPISSTLRKLKFYKVLNYIKTSNFVQKLLFKELKESREKLSISQKEFILKKPGFQDDLKQFKKYFNL
jgi:hypothetical protein